MPLNEFTRITMDGLRKGDRVIAAGAAKTMYEKFESGKEEIASSMFDHMRVVNGSL